MGLDVCLYRYNNFEDTRAREKEYGRAFELLYNILKGGDK